MDPRNGQRTGRAERDRSSVRGPFSLHTGEREVSAVPLEIGVYLSTRYSVRPLSVSSRSPSYTATRIARHGRRHEIGEGRLTSEPRRQSGRDASRGTVVDTQLTGAEDEVEESGDRDPHRTLVTGESHSHGLARSFSGSRYAYGRAGGARGDRVPWLAHRGTENGEFSDNRIPFFW